MVTDTDYRGSIWWVSVFPYGNFHFRIYLSVTDRIADDILEDIPALVAHFVKLFSRRMGKQVDSIPPETMSAFQWHSWPGNIRELQNLVERAVILCRDGVLPNPLFQRRTGPISLNIHRTQACQLSMTSEDSDRALIVETLEQVGWIVGGPRGAAAKLGLKRTTLLAKMRRMGISRPISFEGTDVFGMAPDGLGPENTEGKSRNDDGVRETKIS